MNSQQPGDIAGNPLACAAGIAVTDEVVEKQLEKNAQRLGDYLVMKFEKSKKYGVVREVRGKGILLGVELVKDTTSLAPYPELGMALKRTALKNRLILRVDPTWFAVAPALTAELSGLDELCQHIEKSLADALDELARGSHTAAA
jgi:4-aminobutyrate aminotransferase-like enzyme